MPKIPLSQPSLIYVGCYTEGEGGRGKGIEAARLDTGTGELAPIGTVAEVPAPSYLSSHPDLPVLYAVHERAEGTVSAWRIGPDGGLELLGDAATGGSKPCHLAVLDGYLMVANFGSGSVSRHPLAADGTVRESVELTVHNGLDPHAHQVTPLGDGLLITDLGLDQLIWYRRNDVNVTELPRGTGPRHLALDGRGYVYVAGELDATVTVYAIGGDGLRPHARVPGGSRNGYLSEIAVSEDDRFLYVASRGPDSIATFALDEGCPRLIAETPSGGSWPRHFSLQTPHLYVANERSDTVVSFRVDPDSGRPEPTGEVWAVPSPTCILPARLPGSG